MRVYFDKQKKLFLILWLARNDQLAYFYTRVNFKRNYRREWNPINMYFRKKPADLFGKVVLITTERDIIYF